MSLYPPAVAIRPRKAGFAGWLEAHKFPILTWLMKLTQPIFPVLKLGKLVILTRYDDVRAMLGDNARFKVPYGDALHAATGEPLFILGDDSERTHHQGRHLLNSLIPPADYARLAAAAEAKGEALLQAAPGRIELVDAYLRTLSFALFEDHLGIPPAPGLRQAASGLFECVFYQGDPALRASAPDLANIIATQVMAGLASAPDNSVLARCRALLAQDDPPCDEPWVRSMIGGLFIGGPPQPVIVLAQVMDVLLRRREALAGAVAAARADDDAGLHGHIMEALRFYPLAPALLRVAAKGAVVARGTRHERAVPAGTTVLAGVAAAMFDPRRIARPSAFDARRPRNSYLHHGHGLHECFAHRLNAVLLPAMLKPLLRRMNLARAPGAAGAMTLNGPFPESFWLTFASQPGTSQAN